MEKKNYQEPQLEVVPFAVEDVVTTSTVEDPPLIGDCMS